MDLLGLLLPQRCAVCRRPYDPLCGPCRDALQRLAAPLCDRCGAPTAWPVERCRECSGRRLAFRSARAAMAHDRRAAAFVSAWKEHGLRRLATVAADLTAETLAPPRAETLTFIPADAVRHFDRGHHPAERLACELAARWQLPLENLLARTRSARRQRGLSLAARRRNVAGAFAPRGGVPRRIALVDDVYTTGATASAAASALRRAGAREVHVVTFTRAVRAYS